jgi:hypothetical protein
LSFAVENPSYAPRFVPPQELSPVVVAFLSQHIRSLEELHLLIAVMESGDRWWDAASAGRQLHTSPGAARRALDRLAQENLLDLRITDDVRYQFRPGTDELRAAARACVEAYVSAPLAVLQRVTASRRGLQDFADAFRIRRDDDDR